MIFNVGAVSLSLTIIYCCGGFAAAYIIIEIINSFVNPEVKDHGIY